MSKEKYLTHVKPRLEEIKQWKEENLIELEICKRLGVAMSSFSLYKLEHSELAEIIKNGNIITNYRVVNSLLKRALGFDYIETHTEKVVLIDDKGNILPADNNKDVSVTIKKNGKEEVLALNIAKVKTVTRKVLPDVGAIAFWLKNRMPDEWKEKQEIGLPKDLQINVKMDDKEI